MAGSSDSIAMAPAVVPRAPPGSPRVRWRIFSMLVGFGTIVYFQQRSITVASLSIMPELSLSQMQIGWLQWAFTVSYTAMQFPGGVLGQRLGARRAMTAMMLLAVLATALAPLTPWVLTGTALFVALLSTQFALGVFHGPFMPVCAGAMEAWLPANRWSLAQGLHTAGCQLGAAIAPPVIVVLMELLGWQRALFYAALPPIALIVVWRWYARDTPDLHPGVSGAELAELRASSAAPPDAGINFARVRRILVDRNVLLLTISYTTMNYAYYLIANWCLLYLVQERHLSALEGGVLAIVPPLGAAAGAATGGAVTAALCERLGLRWGYRLLPLVTLPIAGAVLLGAVYSAHAYVAVALLTLAYFSIELNEGSYWGGAMRVAHADTMAATGVMNTGGNLGGIIGIPIVAYLSGHGAWTTTFVLGFASAVLGAVLWLGVDASRPMQAEEPHPAGAGS